MKIDLDELDSLREAVETSVDALRGVSEIVEFCAVIKCEGFVATIECQGDYATPTIEFTHPSGEA